MQFQAKVHLELPFKLDLSGMAERERFLRDDWFWVKEPETLKWIESFEKNTIFWDVGANIGVYSLYSAVLCSASMCYAFEPFLPNYERLKRNVEINGFWHSIKTEQIALSDEVGMANFESKSHEIGSSGGQIGNAKDYVPQNAYPVEITTGDAYAELHGVPNYVKIDVDGQEARVLAGMTKILKNRALKSILVEENMPGINALLLNNNFEPDEDYERIRLRKSDFNRIYRRS